MKIARFVGRVGSGGKEMLNLTYVCVDEFVRLKESRDR